MTLVTCGDIIGLAGLLGRIPKAKKRNSFPTPMPRTLLLPGKPYPQGATWDGTGVNFSLYSETATAVELCLFDDAEARTSENVRRLREVSGHVLAWLSSRQVKLGQLYGYRVLGPYEPGQGHRYNPAKLLIDPATRARWRGRSTGVRQVFPYKLGDPAEDPGPRPGGRLLGRAEMRSHYIALRLGKRLARP